MKCIKCKRKATISIANLNVCSSCFRDIIEKRFRKEIRINALIRSKDRLLIIDDKSVEAKVTIYFLENIFRNLETKIKIVSAKYVLGKIIQGNYDKIVVPWSADMEDEYFLDCIFSGIKPEYLGHYRIKKSVFIKPMLHILHKELEIFARLKNIKFTNKKANSQLTDMLDALESEYPETRFSLLKSAEQIRKNI